MNKIPRISVIMGIYNGECFLREAIDSILNQSYSDFEFIICDDCSTDSTPIILDEYASSDLRIRVIRNNKNLGLAASLNCCINIAKGTYLARMDCDDRSDLERFKIQLTYLDEHPEIAVVATSAFYINDYGQVYAQRIWEREKLIDLKQAVKESPLIHPTVMMRSQSIKKVGGYTENFLTARAEDYDLWCKLCQSGEVLSIIPCKLYYYREDNNITKRKYCYRIQEAKLKSQWIYRTKMPIYYYIYAIKPLLVGAVPIKIYKILHKKRLKIVESFR